MKHIISLLLLVAVVLPMRAQNRAVADTLHILAVVQGEHELEPAKWPCRYLLESNTLFVADRQYNKDQVISAFPNFRYGRYEAMVDQHIYDLSCGEQKATLKRIVFRDQVSLRGRICYGVYIMGPYTFYVTLFPEMEVVGGQKITTAPPPPLKKYTGTTGAKL